MPFDPFQRPSTVVESLESQNYADLLARSQASWDEGSLVSSLSLLLPPVSGGATPTLPTLLSTSATELSRATQRQLAVLVKSRTESLRVALEGALGVSQPPWAMQGSKQVHHLTLSSRVTLAPPSTPTSTPVPLHAVLEAYQLVCPGVGQGVILATLLPTLREWLWRVAQGGGGGVGTVAKPTSVVLELYCNPPPSTPQGSSSSLDVASVFNCVVQLCSTLPAFFAASPTLTPSLTTLLLLGGSSGSGNKQQLLPFPRLLDALADTLPPTFPPSSQSPPHQEALGATLGAALHIFDRAVWDASTHLFHIFLSREANAPPSLLEGAALRWWGTVSGLTEALCKGMKDVATAAAGASQLQGAAAAAAAAVVVAVPSFTPTSLLPRVGMILRNAALLEGKACMDAQNSTILPIGDAIWRVLCTRGGGSASGKQEEEDVVGEEDSILSLLPKDFPHIHTSINPTSPWLIELLRVVPPSAVGVSVVSPPTDFLSWALTSFLPASSSSSSTTTTTMSLSASSSPLSPPTTTPCAQQLVGIMQCLQAVAATIPPVLSGSNGGTAAAPPAHFCAAHAILATTTSDMARLYVAVEGGAFPLHHRPIFVGGKNPTTTTTTLSKGLKEWARVSSRLLASHNDAAYLAHALSRSANATGSGSGSADTGRAMELLRMFAQKALVVTLSQQRERVHAIFNGSAFPSSSSAAAAAGGGGGGGGAAEKPPSMEAFLLTTAKAVGEVIFTTATVCQPLLPSTLLHPFLINLCDVSLERVIRTILTAVEEGEGGGGGAGGGGDEDEEDEEEEGGGLHTPRHRHSSSSNRLTPPKPPPFASALAHIMAATQWAFKHGSGSTSSRNSNSPWVGIRSWERARAMLYVLTVGGGGNSKDGGGHQELIDLGGLSAEEIKGVRELRSS